MALELNGTTGVSLVQDGVVATADIADGAVTDAKITGMASSKLSGALPAIDGSALTGISGGLPDVLLNYNGNTQSIRASSGVSSVTYNGSGDNTVNFSTSFANTNYYIAGTFSNGTSPNDFQGLDAVNPATGSIRVYTCYITGLNSAASPHNVLNFYLAIWSA
jgi:hypothetical protein